MRRAILASVAVLATLAGCGITAPMTPIVGADSQGPENGAPYCMVDRENPAFLTVSGPAGEAITVDGWRRGNLVLVTPEDYGVEVAPDAEPYNGILYNVPGGKRVFVADHECETT
jgi:predicted small lipoprotein YifL